MKHHSRIPHTHPSREAEMGIFPHHVIIDRGYCSHFDEWQTIDGDEEHIIVSRADFEAVLYKLKDTSRSLIVAENLLRTVANLAGGNPGAADTMFNLALQAELDQEHDRLCYLRILDRLGIYGTDIYVLYNDICERNIHSTICVLRAVDCDLLDAATLKDACSRQDYSGKAMIPVEVLVSLMSEY